MKIHSKSIDWLMRSSLFTLSILITGQALAAGTTADTWVGNSATLDFNVGGVAQNDIVSSPLGNDDPTLVIVASPGDTPVGGTSVGFTEFLVDRVLDLLVAADNGDNVPVVPEQVDPALAFTVTNQGNATADIYLMAVYNDSASEGTVTGYTNGATEYFRAAISGTNTVEYYLDVNNDNVLDGGDTALPVDGNSIPYLDEVPEDGVRNVIVVIDILSTSAELISDVATNEITTAAELNGARSAITLVAQVADAGGGADAIVHQDDNNLFSPGSSAGGANADVATTVEDVFADNAALNGVGADTINTEDTTFNFFTPAAANTPFGGFGSETTDTESNGQASDTSAFIFATAEITLTKTVATVCDNILLTDANAKAIPGSYQLYTITVANAGSAGASASLTTLTDTFDTGGLVTFDPDYDDLITGITVTCDEDGPTNGAGDGFQVVSGGSSTRPLSSVAAQYFTSANDSDGADLDTATSIGLDYSLLLPVETGYTAGELKPGETAVVTFQVIID